MRLNEYSIFIDFQEWHEEIVLPPYHLSYEVSPGNKEEFSVQRMVETNAIICITHNLLTIADAMIEVNSRGAPIMYYVAYTPLDIEHVSRVASESFDISKVDNIVDHFLKWVSKQNLAEVHKGAYMAAYSRFKSAGS